MINKSQILLHASSSLVFQPPLITDQSFHTLDLMFAERAGLSARRSHCFQPTCSFPPTRLIQGDRCPPYCHVCHCYCCMLPPSLACRSHHESQVIPVTVSLHCSSLFWKLLPHCQSATVRHGEASAQRSPWPILNHPRQLEMSRQSSSGNIRGHVCGVVLGIFGQAW